MTFPLWTPVVRRTLLSGAALVLAASIASAQTQNSSTQTNAGAYSSSNESSSLSFTNATVNAIFSPSEAAPAAGDGAAGHGGQQYGGGGGTKAYIGGHFAFEAGGGFNAPVGNDTPYITWGGNFTVGGGLHFNPHFSALLEYQFMDNKLPGALIAALGQGASGGNSYINSITGSPVIDLMPKKSNSAYLVGGYGWYHKSTNFSVEECCDFYGYPVTVDTTSFSSNQWGGNLGFGLYHRFGGVYGDSKTKLFAEARYTYIHTPAVGQENGLGTTELIPVTIGVRW